MKKLRVRLCGGCKERLLMPGQKRCNPCHAAYTRQWRRSHPLNAEQKRKDISRSYAGVYLRRGILEKLACERCGSPNSQMHHPDYEKPLLVEWLCRACHLALHKVTRVTSQRRSHDEK